MNTLAKVLFVIDRMELKYFEFNNLVTNFWMIKELKNSNLEVFITTIDNLSLHNAIPFTNCFETYMDDYGSLFYNKNSLMLSINDFDTVIFRPDPPVDGDYINATYIMDFVDRNKVKIINETKSIRNFNEKLHSNLFINNMPKNIVTSSILEIEDFLNDMEEIVLKPLNKCFGSGVMSLSKGDRNTRSIINTMTNNGTSLCMIQKFLPNIKFGDKRILTLGDKVLDYCVVKLPTKDDFKFNTHNDNYVKGALLTESERKIFTPIAEELNKMGLPLVGFDVVDEKILEINVTSPCYFIKEINQTFDVHIEKEINNFLISELKVPC